MSEKGQWRCICLLGTTQPEAWIAHQSSLANLRRLVSKTFSLAQDSKEFTITDYNNDLKSDKDLEGIPSGETLWIIDSASRQAPIKERIAFPPHPKTLTRAGDYEYFAAQGRAPFPYALAELIDNSLRATFRGRTKERNIVVSIALNNTSNPSNGLLSVWDNGCGMTKRELNEWAVMNLSMEDRGAQPVEQAVQRGDRQGASRFLDGNLSYFGVGSKNAAFYLGRRIKVMTRQSSSPYVHELSIAASELEQRYRDGEAVYEEDLVHRQPGVTETLTASEAAFPVTRKWLADEVDGVCGETGAIHSPTSFTRIIIGDLKPGILKEVGCMHGREQLCRSLAHLYHYYLHGEQGNISNPAQTMRHDAPQLSFECISGRNTIWDCNLAEVNDDLESLYLRAQRSDLKFSLDVPGKGQVEGVLYYFPFQNASETLPTEDYNLVHNPISHYAMTQQPGRETITQPPVSQVPRLTQAMKDSGFEEEDIEVPLLQRIKAPLFEAFWQGRLIPGARIESLPFIEAVRNKRGAAAKDLIPDESFLRLRGALFFGPGFLVTRNKLTFRDNLQELLATAVPRERMQEKIFKDWLAQCHRSLDKVTHFRKIGSQDLQEEAGKHIGQHCCAFECISDGTRTIEKGNLVELAVKPHLVGRVRFFSVSQDVSEEGVYANGFVTVQPMPVEVYGVDARKTLPLRRIEKVLEDDDLENLVNKELQKVPASLVVDPAEISDVLVAGAELGAATVTILNGAKQKITKGYLGGERQNYAITQRLWQCAEESEVDKAAAAANLPKSKKKGKKGKQANPAAKSRDQPGPLPGAELIREVENNRATKDAFHFGKLVGDLERAGDYIVEYTLSPPRPALGQLTCSLTLHVKAGPAVEMAVQGEGRVAMATADLMLGEWLPDISLVFKDEYGNTTVEGISAETQPQLAILKPAGEGEDGAIEVPDLMCYFTKSLSEHAKSLVISSLQIFGPPDLSHEEGPLSIFAPVSKKGDEEGCAQAGFKNSQDRRRFPLKAEIERY